MKLLAVPDKKTTVLANNRLCSGGFRLTALDIKMSGNVIHASQPLVKINDYNSDDPKTWIVRILTKIIILTDVFSCE